MCVWVERERERETERERRRRQRGRETERQREREREREREGGRKGGRGTEEGGREGGRERDGGREGGRGGKGGGPFLKKKLEMLFAPPLEVLASPTPKLLLAKSLLAAVRALSSCRSALCDKLLWVSGGSCLCRTGGSDDFFDVELVTSAILLEVCVMAAWCTVHILNRKCVEQFKRRKLLMFC